LRRKEEGQPFVSHPRLRGSSAHEQDMTGIPSASHEVLIAPQVWDLGEAPMRVLGSPSSYLPHLTTSLHPFSHGARLSWGYNSGPDIVRPLRTTITLLAGHINRLSGLRGATVSPSIWGLHSERGVRD